MPVSNVPLSPVTLEQSALLSLGLTWVEAQP